MNRHGGLVPGNEYEKYIDFSASIVPEMPERIKKAAVRAMEEARRYPEPGNQSLKEAIAKKNGLDPENIVCGNGAAELIYRVAQCFAQQKGASERKEALIIEPAFTEYERALSQNGIKVRHYVSTHEGFALTEAFLSELSGETYKNTGVIFIAQPANPTGILTKEGLLTRLAVLCEEKGILLVVDESFYELTEKGKTLWLGPDRRMDRNRAVKREGLKELLILNSFTKLYGMAGLRLGYLIGYDKKLLQKIDSIGQPWPISAPAISAGLVAMTLTEDYRRKLTETIGPERVRMKKALEEMGFKVCQGEANYLLFYSEKKDLCEKLAGQGIVIRDCSDYYGLCEGYCRAAVLGPEENDLLLAALRKVMMEQAGRRPFYR